MRIIARSDVRNCNSVLTTPLHSLDIESHQSLKLYSIRSPTIVTSKTCIFEAGRSKAVLLLWIIYVISVLFLLYFCARLFIDALWSPVGKGLTYWLSFVMSNCEIVTFSLVSWVRCGA